MKIRVLSFISIMMFAANVFGLDYSNEQYGIHFTLPDHWKVIDFESLPVEKQQRLDNRYHPFKTLAICGFKNTDGLGGTTTLIQCRKFKRSTFDKTKRYLRTEFAKEMMITSTKMAAEDAMGQKLNEYKTTKTESNFIKSTNRIYGVVHYEGKGKPKIVAMVVKFLCKDGVVNLRCFARGSEAENFVDTVNKIADSFQYDGSNTVIKSEMSEEEATQLSREQIADNIWKWAGIILTISIVLGVLRMLFFRD